MTRYFPKIFIIGVTALLTLTACTPSKNDVELRQEIQALRTDIQSLKEKVTELSAGQQKLLEMLAPFTALKPPATSLEQSQDTHTPLSVSQLLKDRHLFIGRRLTVRGEVGLVLLHRKSLYLKSPEGLVEVMFSDLPDKKAVDRLTSQDLKRPITVTGQLLAPSPQDPHRLQIIAEAVDF